MDKEALKESAPRGALIAATIFVLVIGARWAGLLERLDWLLYDTSLSLRSIADTPEPDVVIVTVTEDDIRELRSWPLRDETLAQLLRAILEDEPRAVGLDLYRDTPNPPGTGDLEDVLRSDNRVFAIYKSGSDAAPSISPPPVLVGTGRLGFNDVLPDRDGVVRRQILYLGNAQVETSLALRLAVRFLEGEGIRPAPDPDRASVLTLGRATLAPLERSAGGYSESDTRGYQILFDPVPGPQPFRTFRVADVLARRLPAGTLRGKIVLIGGDAISLPDRFPVAGQAAGAMSSGVILQAHMTAALVRAATGRGKAPRLAGRAVIAGWVAIAALLGVALGLTIRRPSIVFAVYVTLLAALIGIELVAHSTGSWLPTAGPIAALTAAAAASIAWVSHAQSRDREILTRLFAQHVSKEVADEIWAHRATILAGSRPRAIALPVTIMFVDLRGFTAAAERLDAEAVMVWIETFTEMVAEEVIKHGGVVDDYFGDGVKADFGVPLPRKTNDAIRADARRAMECALSIVERFLLENRMTSVSGPQGLRIGIASGIAVAGTVGSTERLKYTVIGDVVNEAARLQSIDAVPHDFGRQPCRILVSQNTLVLAGDGYASEDLGTFPVKGKAAPVRVHRIDGRASESARAPKRASEA